MDHIAPSYTLMKTLVEAGERTDGMIEKEKTPSGEIEKALKIGDYIRVYRRVKMNAGNLLHSPQNGII